MTDRYNNYFSPQNYPKLSIETKAMVFDESNLVGLEETYYRIFTFRSTGTVEEGGSRSYLFSKSEVKGLTEEIRKTEAKL